MTLHSWGAIAPSVDSVDKLISYIKTARPALLRWRKTQILIIDEGMPLHHAIREKPHSVILFIDQCRWWMGICSKKYVRSLLGSGRRLIGHLVASRWVP
jgi:hypothetical protein